MGAGLSSLVAGTIPDRILGAVLLEGLGPMVDEAKNAPGRLAKSLMAENRARNRNKRVYGTRDEAIARLAEATGMQATSASILVERGLVGAEDGFRWRADPRLRTPSRLRLTESMVTAYLQAITCPVMVVRARDGWPADPAVMAGRAAAISDLRRVELDGRHHVHLDNPAAVAEPLTPFFAELMR
jgi:pimeloyl-ACP methyl ester carboxylesterase